MNKYFSIWSAVVCFALCLFLTFNMHRQKESFTFKSEIWADKAGYYVYLPAFFIYDLDATNFPRAYAENTGKGFDITDDFKFHTKYSCGVALLQAPFFLAAHLYQKISGGDASGFSLPYQQAIDVAGVFYGIAGLLLLAIFLRRFLQPVIVYLTLFLLFTGTNLYFYMITDTGMSHSYSFFLFAAFLVLTGKVYQPSSRLIHYLLFGLVIGLLVVVRPINMIFLPVFFIVRQEPVMEALKKIRTSPVLYTLLVAATAFIVLIPQLLYWKYISGHFIHYGYTNEGFTNLASPKLLHLWFSSNNGLFFYTPLFFFALLGLCLMGKEHRVLAVFTGLYFIAISYLFASWWCWNYGCSYGCRPFVEFYTLFALPLGFFLQKIMRRHFLTYSVALVMIVLIVVNLVFIYNYDGCWYGTDWDLQEYINVLSK